MRFFACPRNRGYSGINRIAAQKPEFHVNSRPGDTLILSNLAFRAALPGGVLFFEASGLATPEKSDGRFDSAAFRGLPR